MLKELLSYLNAEIYPSMPAKKVKEIKSISLGGGLMDMIEKYCQSKVLKALEFEMETYKREIESKDKLIERLRSGNKEPRVYKERSDNYVGD